MLKFIGAIVVLIVFISMALAIGYIYTDLHSINDRIYKIEQKNKGYDKFQSMFYKEI